MIEAHKPERTRPELKGAPHLQSCFGRKRSPGTKCSCPRTLKRLCREYADLAAKAGAVQARFVRGSKRTFTPIDNCLFGRWTDGEQSRLAGIKLTYLFLLSRTHDPSPTIVPHRTSTLRDALGIERKTFYAHLEWLEEHGFIGRIGRKVAGLDSYGRQQIIVIKPVPPKVANNRASRVRPADPPPREPPTEASRKRASSAAVGRPRPAESTAARSGEPSRQVKVKALGPSPKPPPRKVKALALGDI